MNRDDDRELWDLLGKSQPQALSPFFARNVVREIRQQPARSGFPFGWLFANRAIPAVAGVVALAAAIFLTVSKERSAEVAVINEDVPEVVTKIEAEDYEVVADLDVLLASQEDESWDDTLTL